MNKGEKLEYTKEYDETDPLSIENYAQRLIGKTFGYDFIIPGGV